MDTTAVFTICNGDTPIVIHELVQNDPEFKKQGGIYVIPSDSPTTILYYNDDLHGDFKVCDKTAVSKSGKLITKERKTINHNVIAKNKNIICGGDFYWTGKTLHINNHSGHYQPKASCLDYTICLFNRYGFDAVPMPVGGKVNGMRQRKTRKGTRKHYVRSRINRLNRSSSFHKK
jgi:hypothetical protein